MLSMYPDKSGRTLFSYDLNIQQIVDSFNFTGQREVAFFNFHGFNPTYPYINNKVDFLIVMNSKFDFYLNETTKITRELCVRPNFNQSGVFALMSMLQVRNTVYSTPVCPYVLSNSEIELIYFTGISNSLIYKNELKFIDLNESVLSVRNLNILSVEASYIHLSSSLIHPQLFRNVANINLCCYIHSIHESLLVSFTQLKSIMLDMDTFDLNLRIGFKWLHSLNKDINVRDSSVVKWKDRRRAVFVSFLDKPFAFKKLYVYPDRDLCFFREFPLHRLVYPVLTSPSPISIECTCTVIWLIQYSKYTLLPNLTENNETDVFFNVQHCVNSGYEYISRRIREKIQIKYNSKFKKFLIIKKRNRN